MKKIILTISAIVYLATSAGAAIHLQYCMDKLVSWKLGSAEKEKSKCIFCGMEKTEGEDNGCCKDEHKQIKIEKDQKEAESIFQMSSMPVVLLSTINFKTWMDDLSVITNQNFFTLSLLRSKNTEVNILNCVFRI